MRLSNRIVLGTFFPGPTLSRFLKQPEAEKPGLYILIGTDHEDQDAASELVYVGEGDPVGPRLEEHARKKDFWTQAAVFTSQTDYLTKTHIQFLEARIVSLIKSAGRASLDNRNTPQEPSISEADRPGVESFQDDVTMLVGVAGFHCLRPRARETDRTGWVFEFHPKGARATMIRTKTGYLVRKGSTAVAEPTQGARRFVRAARQRLVEAGILNKAGPGLLQFTADYEFESSSGAAIVICGRDASGPKSWKLSDGRTLEQVDESETAADQ